MTISRVLLRAGFTMALFTLSAVAAALPTVVSTNLCADQAVLGLAAPEQILSVSAKARDAGLSAFAERARDYPVNHGSAEEMLYLRPDIVVASRSWAGSRQGRLLAAQGIRVVTMRNPQTLAEILDNTRLLAEQLGRAETGAALVAELERRSTVLREQARELPVLYLRPNGGSAGRGTYVDEITTLLGLTNLPAAEGIAGWGQYPLELLVRRPPALFLTGFFDQPWPLHKTLYGQHPALRKLLATRPAVAVPETLWSCGNWLLVEAAERIASELAALSAEHVR